MLVLDKKRLSYIAISVILGLSIFIIGKKPKITIPTSSIPVAEHTIVLDAGHGQPDRSELLAIMVFQKKKLIYKLLLKYKNF